MEGLGFMEAEHVFFFIFPWRNRDFVRDETEVGSGDIKFCSLGQDEPCGSIHGIGFQQNLDSNISQLWVFPICSLLYGVVVWYTFHSVTNALLRHLFTFKICTSAEAVSTPCRHGMIVPQAIDQHVENSPERSVWGWQAKCSHLGPDEGGDGLLSRSIVAGEEWGRVSAFPQVILLADFTPFSQAGILAKLDGSLPWCEVPITSFSRQLLCKCS